MALGVASDAVESSPTPNRTGELHALLFAVDGSTVKRSRRGPPQWRTALVVWTVHHDCDRSHSIARTLRSPIKSVIAFDMFFHVEHHLSPSVPPCHLNELSKRLDEVALELAKMEVY